MPPIDPNMTIEQLLSSLKPEQLDALYKFLQPVLTEAFMKALEKEAIPRPVAPVHEVAKDVVLSDEALGEIDRIATRWGVDHGTVILKGARLYDIAREELAEGNQLVSIDSHDLVVKEIVDLEQPAEASAGS
jgi:hypothetical protein